MSTGTITTEERRAAPTFSRGPTAQTGGGAAVAISVSGLVKRFGATRALDGLDLTVRSGARTAPARRRRSASYWG
jgi:hypothetical protein